MYSATKQKQLLECPLCPPIHLDYRDISNYSVSSFKFFVSMRNLKLVLFHKVHALSFLGDPAMITVPFLWFIPCIKLSFCQIFLPADYSTWLSDSCLFRKQKLFLYHKLKWLPGLLLTLSVLHQNIQMAPIEFLTLWQNYSSDNGVLSSQISSCYHCTKRGPIHLHLHGAVRHSTFKKAHYLGSRGKSELQILDNVLIKHDLYCNHFPRPPKSTLLPTAAWERLVHSTNKHQSALEWLPQSALHGWHILPCLQSSRHLPLLPMLIVSNLSACLSQPLAPET